MFLFYIISEIISTIINNSTTQNEHIKLVLAFLMTFIILSYFLFILSHLFWVDSCLITFAIFFIVSIFPTGRGECLWVTTQYDRQQGVE